MDSLMGSKANPLRSYGGGEADMEIACGATEDLAGWWTRREEGGAKGVPWKEEESKKARVWGLEVRVEAMVAIFNEINKRQSVLGSVCVCESVCVWDCEDTVEVKRVFKEEWGGENIGMVNDWHVRRG